MLTPSPQLTESSPCSVTSAMPATHTAAAPRLRAVGRRLATSHQMKGTVRQ